MYNLLIVDDEEFVRNGIKDTICWSKLGFAVIGTAENGLLALEIIQRNAPHVVLTDIKMPEMDGLELIKVASQSHPNIKFVMLSAYDDFKYAQCAIKYGARGYLLKPLEEEELNEIFLKLAQELQEGINQQENNTDSIGLDKSNNLISKAKKYVNDHFDEKITLEEISEYLYITPSYFSVAFKRITRQNFIDYVTQVKIDKSKEFLKKPRYRIREIALKVGYDDYTYYCKVFKKKEKITPLEYRSRILLDK